MRKGVRNQIDKCRGPEERFLEPFLAPVVSAEDQGERGRCRVIYNWDEPTETFYLLHAYGKSERDDLTAQQLRVLGRLVREEFG